MAIEFAGDAGGVVLERLMTIAAGVQLDDVGACLRRRLDGLYLGLDEERDTNAGVANASAVAGAGAQRRK